MKHFEPKMLAIWKTSENTANNAITPSTSFASAVDYSTSSCKYDWGRRRNALSTFAAQRERLLPCMVSTGGALICWCLDCSNAKRPNQNNAVEPEVHTNLYETMVDNGMNVALGAGGGEPEIRGAGPPNNNNATSVVASNPFMRDNQSFKWARVKMSPESTIPPPRSGAASVVVQGKLYMFGVSHFNCNGIDQSKNNFALHNSLSLLLQCRIFQNLGRGCGTMVMICHAF